MVEKDLKANEAMKIGDTIIMALKKEKKPILIGETRNSEEINSVMKAMEYNNGHSVVTTMMCANPSETIIKLMRLYESSKMTDDGALISKLKK